MFIYLFHGFGIAAAQKEIIYWKISFLVYPCITARQKHWEEHDLILYFLFFLSLQKQKKS